MADWMVLAIVTLVMWGFTGLTQKLATNESVAELGFVGFAAAFVPIALVILATQPMRWNLGAMDWFWAILGGALNGFGTLASFAAYRSGGKASIVTPLAALYPVGTVIIAVLVLGESAGKREIAGIVFALAAAVALSWESPTEVQLSAPEDAARS